MHIEGIVLEHFSALPKADTNTTTPSRQCHAVFHYFLSDDRKQDSETSTVQIKGLISFHKEKKLSSASLIKIW